MRLVRKTRLAGLLVMTSLVFIVTVPAAWAAPEVTISDLEGSTIGLEVQKAILGVNISGGGTWNTLDVEFAQVDDADFEITDLQGNGPTDGVAVFRDDGSVDDKLDAGDTKVSDSFSNTGLAVTVTVTEPIPASATGINYLITIATSLSIDAGDDFTMSVPGGLFVCGVHTTPAITLGCAGGSSDMITADTAVPIASPTTLPTTVDGNVVWTFNKDVTGVTTENVVLREHISSDPVPAAVNYDANTLKATINPTGSLSPGTSYDTIVNPTSATELVTDEAGNPVADNTQAGFSLMGVGFTPGVVRGNTWLLSNGPNRVIDTTFKFGKATDFPVAGDWDADHQWQAGVVRGNVWYLANEAVPQTVTSFAFGKATDYPVVGDWDGNGTYTPGLVRGNKWFLSNQIPPATLTSFTFASATDFPVVGDWDGNKSTTPGVVRGNVWYVTNQILPVTVTSFVFGKATDYPIAGDWNDDKKWTAGLLRGDVWFLANEPLPQTVTSFTFGEPTDFPVVGDWDGPITGGSAGAGLMPKLVPGS